MKQPASLLGVLFAIFIMNVEANSTVEIGTMFSAGSPESASIRTAFDYAAETKTFLNAFAASLSCQESKANGQRQASGQKFYLSSQSNYKLESECSLFFLTF